MTVRELKAALDDYGDHLPVLLETEAERRYGIEGHDGGRDGDGTAALILYIA